MTSDQPSSDGAIEDELHFAKVLILSNDESETMAIKQVIRRVRPRVSPDVATSIRSLAQRFSDPDEKPEYDLIVKEAFVADADGVPGRIWPPAKARERIEDYLAWNGRVITIFKEEQVQAFHYHKWPNEQVTDIDSNRLGKAIAECLTH